jgi:hypothetical protein
MKRQRVSDDRLSDVAQELGLEHGKSRGAIITVMNCSPYTASMIIDQYDKKDPEVLSLCPDPLSGGPPDDPPAFHILEQIADKADQPSGFSEGKDQDVMAIYEKAFQEGFWKEVMLSCKRISGR